MKKYVVLARQLGIHYGTEMMVGFKVVATFNARSVEHAMEVAARKGHVAPIVQNEEEYLKPVPEQPVMHKHGDRWHKTTERKSQ